VIGAANLAEVVSKLRERGLSLDEVREALGGLHLDVRPLSAAQALIIGDLRPATKPLGLSLGDRACLALAIDLQAGMLTTDAALASADVGIAIHQRAGTGRVVRIFKAGVPAAGRFSGERGNSAESQVSRSHSGALH